MDAHDAHLIWSLSHSGFFSASVRCVLLSCVLCAVGRSVDAVAFCCAVLRILTRLTDGVLRSVSAAAAAAVNRSCAAVCAVVWCCRSRRLGGSPSGSRCASSGGKGGERASSLGSSRCLTGSTALMVMGDAKMASELLAEAPLASAEEDFSDFNSNKLPAPPHSKYSGNDGPTSGQLSAGGDGGNDNIWTTTSNNATASATGGANNHGGNCTTTTATNSGGDGVDDVCLDFGEESNLGAFSASLEDLVSSFDEKITKCLRDYDQTTEQLAPVQVRSQEEIMKTDQ